MHDGCETSFINCPERFYLFSQRFRCKIADNGICGNARKYVFKFSHLALMRSPRFAVTAA